MTKNEATKIINAVVTLRTNATDETANSASSVYPTWDEGAVYAVDDRVRHDGVLYKCLQSHTAQTDWTPVAAVSLWSEVLAGQDGTEIGEWVQPNSTNPYMKGDRVTYGGDTWVSTIDNNVWAPGVYGWTKE